MTKPTVKLAKSHGKDRWCADSNRMFPKRRRVYCPTEGEAKAVAKSFETMQKNEGAGAVFLTPALRMEAQQCAERLAACGSSLTTATEYYIEHIGAEATAKPVADVVEAFLREKTQAGCRPEYLRVQGHILRGFANGVGGNIHEATAALVSEWIYSHAWSQRTRKNVHQDVGNLFGFAIRKGWAKKNPMLTLTKPIANPTTPGILTPEQAADFLALAAKRELSEFCAIGLFAGVRSAELERLDWSAVNLAKRTIVIDANIAKKRRTRYIPICDNLLAWLTSPEARAGLVAPESKSAFRGLLRDIKFPWPKNAMRHSFASYHFALHQNAALTAAQLGHHGDTATLFAHYRALATAEDAAKYFAILP